MFESFLSPDMTYSCPIWKVGSPDEEESLEDAQMRKIRRMLELADVREGDHLLEIGTGWGALSIEAVRKYNCHVTTLTLSKEQKALAEARIAKAGYSDRITVLLKDYRLLDPAQYQFDRIVTVEMLEAVGREFMPTFFKHMNALLKPRGVLSLQVITIADARFEAYTKAQDFIQKYIFPGGQCPCVASLTEAVYKGSGGELIVDELHNIGPHYAKALRLWREEFVDKFDAVRDATGLHSVYTREFMRRWEYYFAYCEAGFITRALGDVQVRLVKECNEDLVAGIPL
ncbi:Mycolic acid cyclopropane synthase [Chytriomyces sp. MP71]|nr:Mycolic acid cyclopropane synthase [Chytriomyces sp. MP71]